MTPRVIVLGAGANIARAHLHALETVGAQIVGVQDIDPRRAEQVAERIGCPAYTDVQDVLREPADIAVVLAPHPFHAPLSIACLRAGRHVLVEKPLAESVDQADLMLEAARANGRLLAVALQHRTRVEVQAAHQLIRSGGLGKLQRVDLIGTWPRRRSYFLTAPWRGTWRGEGGGIVINQGQHDLDLLTYLAGAPARVVAWTRTRLHRIETEDTAVAMLEWDSGALGTVHLSTCEVDESQRLELTGTAGRLRILPGRLEIVRNQIDFRDYLDTPGNPFEAPPTLPPETVEGGAFDHTLIYRNLLRAVDAAEPLVAPAEEALATLELANAILYASAAEAPVGLPLDRLAYAEFLRDQRRRL
ncbi:MAG TPA: Gfo/Idh/MocA family oxidoreductase [Chloroflexota bacterium]